VVTLHTILKNFSAMPTHTVNICVPSFIEIHLQNEKEIVSCRKDVNELTDTNVTFSTYNCWWRYKNADILQWHYRPYIVKPNDVRILHTQNWPACTEFNNGLLRWPPVENNKKFKKI